MRTHTEALTEAYTATMEGGRKLAFYTSNDGRIFVRDEIVVSPEPVTARKALELLLEAVGDSEFAMVFDGFSKLRAQLLATLPDLHVLPEHGRN